MRVSFPKFLNSSLFYAQLDAGAKLGEVIHQLGHAGRNHPGAPRAKGRSRLVEDARPAEGVHRHRQARAVALHQKARRQAARTDKARLRAGPSAVSAQCSHTIRRASPCAHMARRTSPERRRRYPRRVPPPSPREAIRTARQDGTALAPSRRWRRSRERPPQRHIRLRARKRPASGCGTPQTRPCGTIALTPGIAFTRNLVQHHAQRGHKPRPCVGIRLQQPVLKHRRGHIQPLRATA